jgi:F-type H+-transporting ATPase subunit b
MFITAAAAASEDVGFFADHETWVAITYLLVVIFLAKPVYRKLAAGLDGRRDKIKARLDEADRLRDEAQELLASYQKKQRDAKQEAESYLAQAKAEAERIAAQAAKDIEDLMARRQQQALDRIAQAEADAVRDVRNQAVDLAIEAASHLLAKSLTGDKAEALAAQTIKELPSRLN